MPIPFVPTRPPLANTNWQYHSSASIYLDVNTSGCGFDSAPAYATSLGGDGWHWSTTGATSVYAATATGFRVYVRYSSGASLTPAFANSKNWHINWRVRQETITKYYRFGGQLVAMRKNNALQYLHTDHLGGITAVTNSAGAWVTHQNYYAYGKKRGGGTLPTEANYTGQRLDESGLMYYNARYYHPGLGVFISPDTIVPDPGLVADYNRYMMVRGNPLKYNDPTGHQTNCIQGLDGSLDCSYPSDTIISDENYDSGPCEGPACDDPWFMGKFLGKMYVAAQVIVTAPTLIAARLCRDGDCTNEAIATTKASEKATTTINWLEGRAKTVEHIMAPKHEWGRLVNITGNLTDDYKAVQPLIQQTVNSGMSTTINQSPLGPVVEYSKVINNQEIIVRGVQTAQKAFRISDAWIVK